MKATGLKRMFAVMLAFILVLSLSAPAFASGTTDLPEGGTACTCNAAEGAAHAEGCPKYTAPEQGADPTACTCNAAEGVAHAEGCPKYTAPEQGADPTACTCNAAEGAAHAEGCPKYTAPERGADPTACTCNAAEGAAHAEGCPLYQEPVDEALAQVQAMIDALPDAADITEENADAVKAQLEAIDAAKLSLTEEQLEKLVMDKYMAAAAAFASVYNVLRSGAVAKIGETEYASIGAAINAAGTAPTVIDVIANTTENVEIPAGANITLNIAAGVTLTDNGSHTITNNGVLTVTGAGTVDNVTHAKAAIYNAPGATAILTSGSYTRSNENGMSSSDNGGNSYYVIQNQGTMTIGDVSITQSGCYSSLVANGWYDGSQNGSGAVASLTINGGTFSGGINTIKNDDYGVLVINAGTFVNVAQHALMNWNVATINGGSFENNGDGNNAVVWCGYGNDAYDKGQLTITAGSFISNNSGAPSVQGNSNASISISGGSFSSDVSAYVPDGYASTDTNGNHVVGKATTQTDEHVAVVDGQYFKSVQAAINAVAASGASGTVSVIKSTAESINIPAGATVTLDIASGVTLSDSGDHTITNNGVLTVKGEGTVKNTVGGHGALANYPNATANLDGCTFVGDQWYVIKNLGTMNINSPAVVTQNDASSSGIANGYYGNKGNDLGLDANGSLVNLTIAGGTFSGGMNTVKNDDYGVLTITGGTYTNTDGPAILNWNVANISDGTFTVNNTANSVVANGHLNETADKGQLTISGGTFTAANNGQGVLFGYGAGSTSGGSLNISGGTFKGILEVDSGYPYTPTVSGGTFSTAVKDEYCAADFVPVANPNGTYGVAPENAEYTVTLTYNAEGASNIPAVETLKLTPNQSGQFTVSSTLPDKAGYSFQGWSDTAGAADSKYKAGDVITVGPVTADTELNLYAVWEMIPVKTLTLHYNANRGKNAPADQTVDTTTGSGIIVITNAKPTRYGYFFQGWSTTRNGNVQYRPGDNITISQDTTLYAVWARPTDSPRTGDASNIGLWAAVAGVCLVGVGVAVVIIKKKGGKE